MTFTPFVRRCFAATLSVAAVMVMGLSLTGCQSARARQPVVTINESIVVTRAEYNDLFTRLVKQANIDPKALVTAAKDSQEAQLAEQIKQVALNKLIFSALVEDAADQAEVEVTPEELAEFKTKQVDAMGGDEALKVMLKAKDMTETTFDEALTEQLLVQQFVDEHLATQASDKKISVAVSDAEARKFYNSQKPLFYRSAGVNAAHILLKVIPSELKANLLEKSPNISKKELDEKIANIRADKRAEAEQLLDQLKQDPKNLEETFTKLAKAHSEDELSAIRGGELDTLFQHMTDPKFWEATQQTTPGKLYPEIVESAFGYHILWVHNRVPAGQQPYAKVAEDIKQVLKQQRRQGILMDWVSKTRENIALEYADGYEPKMAELEAPTEGADTASQDKQS